jgi:hypothetical protein
MKTILALTITLIFSSFCYGQTNYFQSKTITKGREFSFPIFSNSANSYAADKINRTLQIPELKLLKGYEKEHIFEEVVVNDGRIYGGKVSISSTIENNSDKVVSVKLDQSSCGATCHYWVKYYNFNSGNGDLIQLKDLFTDKGLETFSKFITKRRVAEFNKERAKLKTADSESLFGIAGSYESDDLEDFYIKNNTLFIDGENSFAKNDKFYGVNTISKFKLSEFKNYLNDYGKTLFSLSKNSIKNYRSSNLPQLFQGKIAGKEVWLFLNTGVGNELKAEYIYSKYGKGIFLSGTFDGNEVILTEKLPKPRESGFIDYIDGGVITAKFDGRNMSGNWSNEDKTKTYALELTQK